MGLLADIQSDAITDSTPVATLLRKCMVLASRLDVPVLEDWVKWELDGYPTDVDVPEYRRIPLNFKAQISNGFVIHSSVPVAQYLVKKATGRDEIDVFSCRQAVGTINYAAVGDGQLTMNMDNIGLLIRGKAIDKAWEILKFWAEMPTAKVQGINDAVRNKILEFTLALQKRYPDAGEVDGPKNSDKGVGLAVTQIFNTTINGGNAGVIGSAHASTVNITVNHGNLQDLRQQLTQHGVSESDFKELESALIEEPKADDGKLGPKVAKWVSGMLGKAASGVWDVGLGAGGALLEKALLGYYGFE